MKWLNDALFAVTGIPSSIHLYASAPGAQVLPPGTRHNGPQLILENWTVVKDNDAWTTANRKLYGAVLQAVPEAAVPQELVGVLGEGTLAADGLP